MKKVTWSHSSLKDYEGCPRRYYESKVLKKYPFTDTQATIYGKELHEAAEFYIKDDKPLPQQFEFVKDTLDADRKSTRLNSSHIPLSRMPSSA